MRYNKKHTSKLLLVLLSVMLLPFAAKSQVTIGSNIAPHSFSLLEITAINKKGGLRLPQLTTAERNALDIFSDPEQAKGLVIYNTDNNCLEYWNYTKWVSLCIGNADIIFTGPGGDPDNPSDLIDPTQPPFPPEGDTKGPFVPHDKPECETQIPAYTLTVMSGDEYTRITVINETTGEFKITMFENHSIRTRTAIVRVTNNCTGEYKEFLFTQLGLDENAVCDMSKTVPGISGLNGTDICKGGAVYLYLNGVNASASDINDYIWTCDGKEVGRGASHIAEKSGTYVVYYKTVGCPQNSGPLTVGSGTAFAPGKITGLVVENDGYVCDAGGTVRLLADVSGLQPGENIIWFKDDELQTMFYGLSSINAAMGVWYCAVIDGDCTSLPSESKTVRIDPNAGKGGATVNKPTVAINGVLLADAVLCRGGVVILEVTNPQSGVDYVWKLDNTVIGFGTSISYPIPSVLTGTKAVRCTAIPQLNDACRTETFAEKTVSSGSIPPTPYITVNTKDALCGGSATLTANFTGSAAVYNWYRKNGTELMFIASTGTDPNFTVTLTGEYAVSVISGGCSSSISGSKTIAASDFGILSWTLEHSTVNTGDTKTFSVQVVPDHKTTYYWSVINGTITNGQGTNSVTVHFPTVGAAKVSVAAENACGSVSGITEKNVNVADACTPPAVTQNSGTSQTVTAGSIVNMSITAMGTPALTYQWYSGPVGTTTNPVSGQTGSGYAPVLSSVGTHTYWCKVSNDCGNANSAQFTVTVNQNPANIPTGSGSLGGRTCFDVALSNDNQYNCGLLSSRITQQADFNLTKTSIQTYVFTPSGTVSKVRFAYVESRSGMIVQSLTPSNPGYETQTNITGACSVVLAYKTSLNNDAYGLTSDNALKVDIYAIYNDNASGTGNDKAVKLTATIKDCACCGAATASGWLNFMCHNLGADESLDPFTWNNSKGDRNGFDVKGDFYQWGRSKDGHEKRNSSVTTTLSNTPNHNLFIQPAKTPYDWRSNYNNTLWGNGTQNENVPKGVNDPCPAGWKIPSQKQWQSIADNNNWQWTGNGYMVGQNLYLPAAGDRNYGSPYTASGVGTHGIYWSSTNNSNNGAHATFFRENLVNPLIFYNRANGYSVRCVQE